LGRDALVGDEVGRVARWVVRGEKEKRPGEHQRRVRQHTHTKPSTRVKPLVARLASSTLTQPIMLQPVLRCRATSASGFEGAGGNGIAANTRLAFRRAEDSGQLPPLSPDGG